MLQEQATYKGKQVYEVTLRVEYPTHLIMADSEEEAERIYKDRWVDTEPADMDMHVEPHFQNGDGAYLAEEIDNDEEVLGEK